MTFVMLDLPHVAAVTEVAASFIHDQEMERRHELRIPAEVFVRIAGVDAHGNLFAQNARARSLSHGGALLTGIEHDLRCGDGLFLQREGKEAKFKVVWVRDGLAAVQRAKDEPCLWEDLLQPRALGAGL
jgi:hypothetical protein